MGFFDVEFDVLRVQLLPVKLRAAIMKAWIKCLLKPLVWLYDKYMANRAANLYYLAHNSQVCYMEAALNDLFDNEDRRIYVGDGPQQSALYIYLASEEKEVYLPLTSELPVTEYEAPVYLYTEGETMEFSDQFIVYYPDGLVFDLDRMKALINKYRLPSKNRYSIEAY